MLEYITIEIHNGVIFVSIVYDNYFMGERDDLFLIKQATLGM